MNCGRVEQIGTPVEIYDQPLTRFVADFIGDTNIFRGERVTTDAGAGLAVGRGLVFTLPAAARGSGVLSVALRPEKIRLSPAEAAGAATGSSASGSIESTNFLGGAVLYRVSLDGGHRILAQQPNAGATGVFVPGQTVKLDWNPIDLVVLKD
jgi:putative spermidine/putrescine transport system ATP-binding protein